MAKDFKVGDIITSYHSGIHKVTSIEDRTYNSNGKPIDMKIIHYTRIANSVGNTNIRSKLKNSCNDVLCSLVTKESIMDDYSKEVSSAAKKSDALMKLLESN